MSRSDGGDTLDSYVGEVTTFRVTVVDHPMNLPDAATHLFVVDAVDLDGRPSELVPKIRDQIGAQSYTIDLRAREMEWGAHGVALEIAIALSSSVAGAALWEFLKSVASSQTALVEEPLSRADALHFAKAEIARAFPSVATEIAGQAPNLESVDLDGVWTFTIELTGRHFETVVEQGRTGLRIAIAHHRVQPG